MDVEDASGEIGKTLNVGGLLPPRLNHARGGRPLANYVSHALVHWNVSAWSQILCHGIVDNDEAFFHPALSFNIFASFHKTV